jgi:predicted RND superfamily exporter protein
MSVNDGDPWVGWQIGVRRPRTVLLATLVCTLLLAVGAGRLSFDPRYSTFFEADDPQLRAFEELREVFAPSDAVAFVVEAPGGDVFGASGLGLLETLTERGWRLPFATRVDSLTNYPHASVECDGETCDEVIIAPLVEDASAIDAAGRAAVREIALAAPEVAGRLVDRDGAHAAVVVTVRLEGDPLTSTQTLVEAARELAVEVESAHAGARVHVGGIMAMNHAFSESSLTDSAVLLPTMFVLILLGLAWLLGGISRSVAVFAVVLVAVLAALGTAGWAGMVLTTPAAIAPIIIATIAVADGVHVVLGQFAPAEDYPESRETSLERSLEENRLPVLLTTATTAAGFLSMNFSAVPPFRDLGNLVALGVLYAGVLSLTALPALLRLLPAGRRRPPMAPGGFGRFADFVLANRRPVLLGAILALLFVLPGVHRLAVNDDFVAYFDPRLPFRAAAELTDAHLGGMYELEQELQARDGSIHDPVFLAEISAYTDWLRAQPETGHVLAWTDVQKRLNRTLVGGGEQAYELPTDAGTAAQYALLFELSLPLGLDLTNMLAPDYGSVRQLVTLRDVDSRAVLAFEARAMAWLAANAPHVLERHGGINLMFAHISERNVEAMFEGNVLAVVLIALMLGVALRSTVLAGASLATNLVPVLAAFGLWGWAAGDLGLALSTTFGMTLGIVVDDTVHLLARYSRRQQQGDDAHDAVRASLVEVGPALVVTTVVLLVGFAVLATSTFAINGLLARITLVTLVLALAFDLLALPALLAARGPQTDDSAGSGG